MCLAHLGRTAESEAALAPLRAAGAAEFADLFSDVGAALAAMGQFAQARLYLQALLVRGRCFSVCKVHVGCLSMCSSTS